MSPLDQLHTAIEHCLERLKYNRFRKNWQYQHTKFLRNLTNELATELHALGKDDVLHTLIQKINAYGKE